MPIATIPAPKSVDEIGVRRNLLEDLALKIIYMADELSLHELARRMQVGLRVADELFQRLRKDRLCEVTGMEGTVHRFITTTAGRSRALELMAQNRYTGPAPVSFNDYKTRIQAQSVRDIKITPADVERAFKDLVLDAETLNRLGSAAVSGRALFLHGPAGTGKTLMAETLSRLFMEDLVFVPYAVEMDGQIIEVYDSILHRPVEQPNPREHDGRWVMCRRPRVLIGGELTIDMLDLQFDPSTGYYAGPLQMKANNGLLIIDDFGRQRIGPKELLNRWVVPLDRRIDFFTLAGGKKIEIPFDLLLVFATNLDPAEKVEETFLRRISTKIKVDYLPAERFCEIFRRACVQLNLQFDETLAVELIGMIKSEYNEHLRACYPRDILQQIIWAARYQQKEPILDRDSMIRACRSYMVTSRRDVPSLELRTEPQGFGPLVPLLEDQNVSDILIDNFDKIYVEREGKLEPTGHRFESEAQLRSLIDSILATVGRRVDECSPMADARLMDGSRVNVIVPPLAVDGPSMSIRRFRRDALQLSDLVAFKALTPEIGELLQGIVKARLNVLISGGTGSGKTTLLNVLSSFIPPSERIVTVEDSAELQLKHPYVVRLETRPPDLQGKGEIVQRDLVKNSLRMRPDRIIVGEVRGAEVLDMLQAMNTGHDGSLSTIHANSPRDALTRLETLVAMSGLNISFDAIRKQISTAIDIIIQVSRLSDGSRKLVSLQEIVGMEGNVIVMQEVYKFEQTGVGADGSVTGRFCSGGVRPRFIEAFTALGIEVPRQLFDKGAFTLKQVQSKGRW
jgi:pilus assembly protein CpaF